MVIRHTCSEVSDIAKNVENGDNGKTERCRSLDRPDGVLHLSHDIEGVLVALVGEGDVDQSIDEAESACLSGEGITEVRPRILDTRSTAENDKPGDRDAEWSAAF